MPDADDMVVVVFDVLLLFLLLVLFARSCWSKKRKEKKRKTKTVVVPTCDILCMKNEGIFFVFLVFCPELDEGVRAGTTFSAITFIDCFAIATYFKDICDIVTF